MRILVTGASGVIGRRVVSRFLKESCQVVAFDRHNHDELEALNVKFVRGDICDLDLVTSLLDSVDVVVHLAAIMGDHLAVDPVLSAKINIVSTLATIEQALAKRIERIVLASSIAVFGSDADYGSTLLPLKEDAPRLVACAVHSYGGAKLFCELMAEDYAKQGPSDIIALRPGSVYGAERTTGTTGGVTNLVARAFRGEKIEVKNGQATICAVHVDDVAAAFVACALTNTRGFGRARFYNLGGDRCTVREFAEAVSRAIPSTNILVEDGDDLTISGFAATICDDLIREEIGFHCELSSIQLGINAEVRELEGITL